MMRVLRQLIFMAIFIIGFSLTAMAQRQDDNKNRPPKDPPTIPAPDKNRPPDKPRDNNNTNRPKKPSIIFVGANKSEIGVV